ncbi:hypothetical protein CALCODRAFT_523122 [Calocera cornea HHB12733]|uniref:Uncharacterized protein n=1 Tax=Calocera cornea HHB12733 TaxID=1353952 RepID=A0A165I1E3_9BASI|nr:hypothetical protein CALCODRAFT_523122 [Calocera cornea HHB12733]
MGGFPADDPLVRQALALIRLQVLTPLSVLVSIGASLVCAIVVRPTMGEISKNHPTSLTPLNLMVGIYWLVLWLMLVGYCVLLVIARKEETKATIVHGVGLRFVIANWFLAFWSIAFALQAFIAALVLLSITLLLLLSVWVTLVFHPPHLSRPLDFVCIHAPIRLLTMALLMLALPHAVFLAVGWVDKLKAPEGGGDVDWGKWAWPAFGFIVGLNTVGLINVAWKRDVISALAGVWLVLSIGLSRPKPAPVFAAVILFTVLYPLTWIAAFAWATLRKGESEGRIVLPPDEEERLVQDEEAVA